MICKPSSKKYNMRLFRKIYVCSDFVITVLQLTQSDNYESIKQALFVYCKY